MSMACHNVCFAKFVTENNDETCFTQYTYIYIYVFELGIRERNCAWIV